MDIISQIAQMMGIAPERLYQIVVLTVVLFVGLIMLRIFMKLTATLFRVGCFIILFVVAAVYLVSIFGPS